MKNNANEVQTPIISTLHAPISPPPTSVRKPPSLAAIESGEKTTTDHLQLFSSRLSECLRPLHSPDTARISIENWKSLYQANSNPKGHHFVIHQHDHPIAGPHYDLRLQFSASSSLSWSIVYGLPGDANSERVNRGCVETRVHCYWNHLIETASAKTGSMLIWDTGVYEVLPPKQASTQTETESEESDVPLHGPEPDKERDTQEGESENEKLRRAFQNDKIRLRLHGTKLPKNYTITLRRDKTDLRSFSTHKPHTSPRKRRRIRKPVRNDTPSPSSSSTHSESESELSRRRKNDHADSDAHSDAETGAEAETEADYRIRRDNAYPGATNDVGSVHQRRWFITLDRVGCGFGPETDGTGSGSGRRWVRARDPRSGELLGFEPFYVRGPAVERSVVTGRVAREVLEDEGVEGFVSRRGWRAILV